MGYREPDLEALRDREEARRAIAEEEARQLARFGQGVRAFPWRAAVLAVVLFTVLPPAGCASAHFANDPHTTDVAFALILDLSGGIVGMGLAIFLFPRLRAYWEGMATRALVEEIVPADADEHQERERLRISASPPLRVAVERSTDDGADAPGDPVERRIRRAP